MVDFTKGSCLKQLIRFSVPLFIGNLFQQLYTIVDSMLLGRLVSPDALAAAGTATPVVMLLLSVIGGFTLGVSLVAAGLRGRRDEEGIRRLVESTFLADLAIGGVLAAAAFFLARPILQWMRTPPEVLGQAVLYLRIVAVGIVFQCLYQYIADVLRGLGDSRTPLLFLVLSTVLNIVLDLAFILWLSMDVAGVAYATVLAQLVSALCCLAYSVRRYGCFRLNLRPGRIDRPLLVRSLKLGVPSAMQQAVGSLGALGMQSVVNGFGQAAMNGYNAAYKNLCGAEHGRRQTGTGKGGDEENLPGLRPDVADGLGLYLCVCREPCAAFCDGRGNTNHPHRQPGLKGAGRALCAVQPGEYLYQLFQGRRGGGNSLLGQPKPGRDPPGDLLFAFAAAGRGHGRGLPAPGHLNKFFPFSSSLLPIFPLY